MKKFVVGKSTRLLMFGLAFISLSVVTSTAFGLGGECTDQMDARDQARRDIVGRNVRVASLQSMMGQERDIQSETARAIKEVITPQLEILTESRKALTETILPLLFELKPFLTSIQKDVAIQMDLNQKWQDFIKVQPNKKLIENLKDAVESLRPKLAIQDYTSLSMLCQRLEWIDQNSIVWHQAMEKLQAEKSIQTEAPIKQFLNKINSISEELETTALKQQAAIQGQAAKLTEAQAAVSQSLRREAGYQEEINDHNRVLPDLNSRLQKTESALSACAYLDRQAEERGPK